MNDLLDGLNPAQKEAVLHAGGPALVLAGAGSGKTRVITQRIAHLILRRGVDPSRIVAVTFTNKAAGEMRQRVLALIGARSLGAWIGTFHALCLRILRKEGSRIGLDPGFNIYDTDDQLAVVRRILKDAQTDDSPISARLLLSRISRSKNAMESPADVAKQAYTPEWKTFARVFDLYERSLRRANAVDFDDLLLRALELLGSDSEVARSYAEGCEHLLVDEYQDTNRPQYLLVRALSSAHDNVFVVGDEDQSIYRFRGAEIRNILDFEKDYPSTRVIKLEQNYRSTETILRAAGALISQNALRKGKSLWTENPKGQLIELYRAGDDRTEATWVARKVEELQAGRPLEEIAVLFRTNAQSRQFEEAFRRDRVPYQVVGAVQFYERKEVKDLLAYLKLLVDPADDVAFRRIVNTPPRGIGDASLGVVEDAAREAGLPLERAAALALERGLLPGRPARMLKVFLDLLGELRREAEREPASGLLRDLVDRLAIEDHLRRTHPGEGADRMDNIRALISAAAEYEQDEEGGASVQGFLDRSALVSDADDVGTRPGVTLMTIHCAKGLEFPVVFLAGLEEHLFPHVRSLGAREDLEEERRLCYVALTRAKERLLLSYALQRRSQGVPVDSRPSRFLSEIPEKLIEETRSEPSDAVSEGHAWLRTDRVFAGGSSAARAAARSRESPASASRPILGPETADGFRLGAAVRHPRFGTGQIIGREGEGKHLKLTIHFLGLGSKKILPAYTELEVMTPAGPTHK